MSGRAAHPRPVARPCGCGWPPASSCRSRHWAPASAMMALGGAMLAAAVAAGVLAAPLALRGLGSARVVLRYVERLVTHAATFRALADLRVWFFRNLARSTAGGLGFRQAGDVLARLVGDIEALDGLYLRILVPLAGAVLLLPLLLVVLDRPCTAARWRWRSASCSRLRPSRCRGSAPAWRRAPVWHWPTATRCAADRRARCADRIARGARVRRRGPHAGRGAGARGDAAGHTARTRRPHRAGQCRRVPVRAGGHPCHPDRGGHQSGGRRRRRVPGGGGVRGGGRAAARRRPRRPCRGGRASRAGGRRGAGAGARSAAPGADAVRLRAALRCGPLPLAARTGRRCSTG